MYFVAGCLFILANLFVRFDTIGCAAALSLAINSSSVSGPSKDQFENEPRQSWGFVPVRAEANMFWWLYYAKPDDSFKNYPLVIWLQGGPGASSTGFGNFAEIGPLKVNLEARNNSWLNYANLLFIDNPVGSGYSYVTSKDALTRNNSQIAQDLITCLMSVMKSIPDLQPIPIYIFSESYGGKMTATFARHLNDAISSGKIVANLKGIALGDSWISPIDSTESWSQYLYALSLIDRKQESKMQSIIDKIKVASKAGKGREATKLWSNLESLVDDQTNGVNWYNILKDDSNTLTYKKWLKSKNNNQVVHRPSVWSKFRHVHFLNENDSLDTLMNGAMRKKLGIPPEVTWGNQSDLVFDALSDDFMNPVIADVDYLLKSTNITVAVYTGQLDLIVNTLGTEKWLSKLTWPQIHAFDANTKKPFVGTHGNPKAFVKKQGNLSFYWILQAGHMIPSDQLDTSVAMLKDVIKQ